MMMKHPVIILASAVAAAGATLAAQGAQRPASPSASGAGIVRAHAAIKGEAGR
jgi:hypothetical protein